MRSPTILIPHILRNSNGKPLARTRIAKLLYLIDLSWLELYNHTLTGLPYEYHRDGPYCNEIEAALWSLEDDGAVLPYNGGSSCEAMQFQLEKEDACQPLDDVEQKVLKHVVARFGDRALLDLIDFVSNTPPMVRIRDKRFHCVEMQLESSARRFSSEQLLRLIDQREAADEGEYKCLTEVLSKLVSSLALPILGEDSRLGGCEHAVKRRRTHPAPRRPFRQRSA